MSIKQISVFLENRQGSLEEFTHVLGESGIDLIALSMADTSDFGIVRAIVDDTQKALDALRAGNFPASLTEVLAVTVPDSPGGLAAALGILREGGFSIEYIYSFVRRVEGRAVIILRVDRPEEAAALLAGSGIRMLAQDEISCDTGG